MMGEQGDLSQRDPCPVQGTYNEFDRTKTNSIVQARANPHVIFFSN
jgi:hypothetical protein